MTAPRSPQSNGRLSSRFSLRSSSKSSKRKGVRFWFSSSSKAESDDSDDLAADAAAAARELDEEFEKTKQRTESNSSYVPRVEYGSPHCNEERDAPWTSNEQVEQHYAALGWAVVSIAKDGNCLFRAISDQLYTNELFHQDIRQRLVDFIQREEKLFQPFIEDEQVSDYCARMRKDGEWGGHLELYAAARLFNIHIVVHTGPVRRLRVTNDDEGDIEKKSPPPPPYRVLQLLFKNEHYSSLHSNDEVKSIVPQEEYTVVSSEDKVLSKIPVNKGRSNQNTAKKLHKIYDPTRKTVHFKEVVEARPPPREDKVCLYQEEDVPECGVFLPKQVLFNRGKRRVSGATLFSLVHVPSKSNLLPVIETTSTSETSNASDASTATTSSSEEQENEEESTSSGSERPRPKAPTLRAVPVEYPSKATFHKGRATAAVC
ncbi:OTU domain-containing protein 3 [Phytophthora citrophthora]|uniref:OTU domain-containing protein 1 n=1 Tax=Phytophthora citrophthora TaxID=4793 RepID=A0AAD9GPK6_9STRA|nr:OTU domain-containing protein 3 [Phytophthora citrophthora]